MKLGTVLMTGLLALCAGGVAWSAGPPPLDRPTPPPCCADGYCYPNPTTFGWYERRWRRWPTEVLEPTPAVDTPPAQLIPDIRPFETPPMEEEDRRAPPPTRPAEAPEADEEEAGPEATSPPTMPLGPPGGQPRPSTDFPFDDDAPATEPPTGLPFGEPTTEPPTGLPFGEPTGDLDPAPAPPFASPAQAAPGVAEGPGLRSADRKATSPVRRPAVPARAMPANDPPPALRLALNYGAF